MIILKNNKPIAKAKLLTSVWQHAIGLMFSKQKNLIFKFKKEKIHSLHMFFVFYPIDVVFLNKDKEIVELKQNFMPFTFYKAKNKAMYVLELKKGTISHIGLRVRNLLEFSK